MPIPDIRGILDQASTGNVSLWSLKLSLTFRTGHKFSIVSILLVFRLVCVSYVYRSESVGSASADRYRHLGIGFVVDRPRLAAIELERLVPH